MSNTQRMGRGLEALMGGAEPQTNNQCMLKIDLIFTNPNQPRKQFSSESLSELASSIKQQGIIQPLLVRPKGQEAYELVAGERRYRAAKIAGLDEVPVFIREFTDVEVMAAAIIENIQREDLSPLEEAHALHNLREECGITQEELASKLGKSRSAITNSLRLLQLPVQAQHDLQNAKLSAGHARAILSLAPNENAQEELRENIIAQTLSVRDTEAAVQCFKEKDAFPWALNSDSAVKSSLETQNLEKRQSSQNSRKKDPILQELQQKIKNKLELKTVLSGNNERGRLTLTFTNADELNQILKIFDINH